MTRNKSVVVTFRVDEHLAEALDRLPDKSAFIRDALRQSFHATCPACGGEGRVDCDAADWLRGLLERERAETCDCCGTAYPPRAAAAMTAMASGARVAERVADRPAAADDAQDAARQLCAHCGPEGHQH